LRIASWRGAIQAVAPHPTDPKVIFIGAVNGGIWKTTNATDSSPTWQPLTDDERSLSIGAIAFDPTDTKSLTLVAGVGRLSSYRRSGGELIGLLRTTDGGVTWKRVAGVPQGLHISGVVARGDIIVISTENSGVFRGDLSGNWKKISGDAAGGLPEGVAFDLAGDPADPRRLFANGGTSGIFRSTNTGETWVKVSDAAIDRLLGEVTDNIRIAVGPSGTVYVGIANNGSLAAVFRSSNGGESWTALDLPQTLEGPKEKGTLFGVHPGRQAEIHFSLVADRTSPDIVYVGGDRQPGPGDGPGLSWPNSIDARTYSGRIFRIDASRPRGRQATHITHSNTASNSAPHADSRDMAIAANGDLIEVQDGGIYRRTSPQSNAGDWFSLNGNIQVTEFHAVAWDALTRTVIGGAQDTGTPEQVDTGRPRWRSVSGGDGGVVAVDSSSLPGLSIRYSSSQRLGGFSRRVYDATNTLQSRTGVGLHVIAGGSPLQAQFYTPVVLNTIAPGRLIIGGKNSVYESSDGGDTIEEIGPGILVKSAGAIAYGAAGTRTQQTDAGPAFERKDPQLLPAARLPGVPGRQFVSADGRHVLSIEPNPADPIWEKFVWTVYERNTGQRIGQLKAHASYAPFFVSDHRIVYVTGPHSRRTAAGMLDEPHQIRAVDLQKGDKLWSQPVRDMEDPQGPPP
jgi:hypothetical protein